jgi:CubicO group peptidase (beta-lactamase class C family)
MKFKAAGLLALIMTVAVMAQPSDESRIARFGTLLENLRQDLKIPTYSAAIVKDQKVIWAKGFGYADVENKIRN